MTKPQLDLIEEMICEKFEIHLFMLKADTRKREIVEARQVYAYILKTIFEVEPKVIAGILWKHRTSIYHSSKTVLELKDSDKKYAERLANVEVYARILKKQFDDVIVIEIPFPANLKPEYKDLIIRATRIIEELRQALLQISN